MMQDDIKRQKFVKIVERRVTKVIKDLRLIGNLSNKRVYRYNDEDIKKIISAIETEMRNLKNRFTSSGDNEQIIFKI